jgi:hypothetical protein
MITEYKEYIDRMKKYRTEWELSVKEFKDRLLNDFLIQKKVLLKNLLKSVLNHLRRKTLKEN